MTLRGVNLGGWLVAECWITPSLFENIDARNEYQLSKMPGGVERLRRHHREFIQEDDIAWLAEQGIELLRVPVGHWIFGDPKPYIGTIDRLDWLIETTKKYDLQVLICLHGAPGAQNAAEHSGSGNQQHDTRWLKNKAAQRQTIDVLCKIADRYEQDTNIWGIELLNEPDIDRFGLRLARFHRRAYRALVRHARPGMQIVFSDAFHPWLTTNTFWLMKRRDFPVALDSHLYYCFGDAKQRTFTEQLKSVDRSSRLVWWLSKMQPVIVGEWSAMLPYKVGKNRTQQFISRQKDTYTRTIATCYWTYKTEAPGRWNYRWMIENGYEP
ncbi:MAG TPA: cellulase family glycosylhydrolase [Candidatus Saccharimonadales bacterium]